MRKIFIAALIFFSAYCFNVQADRIGVLIEEQDGTPNGYAYKLIVSNTTLSLSNSVATITTGGGGSTAWDDIGDPDAADEIDFASYVTELNVEDFRIGDGGTNYFRFTGSYATATDDYTVEFGTVRDWKFEYNQTTGGTATTESDQLMLFTDNNGATAATDPMFQILVDFDTANGTNVTSDQDVFGVAKGTQAANVDLFVVDEDGDIMIGGEWQAASATSDVVIQLADKDGTYKFEIQDSDGNGVFQVHSDGGLPIGGILDTVSWKDNTDTSKTMTFDLGTNLDANDDVTVAIPDHGADVTWTLAVKEYDNVFTADQTISLATPDLVFDDTDGADGLISVDANDADDAVMEFAVDDSGGDDQVYIQLDGVNEVIDLLQNTVLTGTFTDGTATLNTGAWTGVTSITVGNTGLVVGSSTPFSDSTGTLTLQNVDAIDGTTETVLEDAIDTLTNSTGVNIIPSTASSTVLTLKGNNGNAVSTLIKMINTDDPDSGEVDQKTNLAWWVRGTINNGGDYGNYIVARIVGEKEGDYFATTEDYSDFDGSLKFYVAANNAADVVALTLGSNRTATFNGNINVSAGYIDAGVRLIETTTDVDVTVDGNTGYYINNHNSTIGYTLPADPETTGGHSKYFCFRNRQAQVITITPATGDIIELEGVDAAAGEAIVSVGAVGEFICLQGFDDGGTDRWVMWEENGAASWAEASP